MIDATRHVGGQHQQEIDLLGGARRRLLAREERNDREPAANDPHHGSRSCSSRATGQAASV